MVRLNVPNVLTVIRILLVPVVVVALLDKTGSGDLLAAIALRSRRSPTRSTGTSRARATR